MKKLKLMLAALSGAVYLSGCAFFGTQTAGSVAIIGGADGPTAIFTATRFAPRVLAVAIPLAIIVVAVAVGVFLYIRRKKK